MYCLYGIVGKSTDLLHENLDYPSAGVVHLGQGIGMIPLSEELLDAFEQDESLAAVKIEAGFEFLSTGVAELAKRLSRRTMIAYLEAEFISGEGTESSVVWSDGTVVLGPLRGTGAVNRALRALGVSAPSGRQEFEVVGLGKHRRPRDWLKDLI